nr:serine/arginine-rich splicing factor SR45-like [Lolium perenne]
MDPDRAQGEPRSSPGRIQIGAPRLLLPLHRRHRLEVLKRARVAQQTAVAPGSPPRMHSGAAAADAMARAFTPTSTDEPLRSRSSASPPGSATPPRLPVVLRRAPPTPRTHATRAARRRLPPPRAREEPVGRADPARRLRRPGAAATAGAGGDSGRGSRSWEASFRVFGSSRASRPRAV